MMGLDKGVAIFSSDRKKYEKRLGIFIGGL